MSDFTGLSNDRRSLLSLIAQPYAQFCGVENEWKIGQDKQH